jgi:hypothetical protein
LQKDLFKAINCIELSPFRRSTSTVCITKRDSECMVLNSSERVYILIRRQCHTSLWVMQATESQQALPFTVDRFNVHHIASATCHDWGNHIC